MFVFAGLKWREKDSKGSRKSYEDTKETTEAYKNNKEKQSNYKKV